MSKNLLVIDFNSSINYYEKFKNKTLSNGTTIKIEQTGWKEISLNASSENNIQLTLAPNTDNVLSEQKKERSFSPDFLLIRNFPHDLNGINYYNVLYGFMFANLPAVNSLQSIYMCSNKPVVYGALKSIESKLQNEFKKAGKPYKEVRDAFPVIPQQYLPNIYSSNFDSVSPKTFPVVAKIGTIHSGYGKMKLNNQSQLNDFKTCAVLNNTYYTIEPYIDNVEFDYRLQKIGSKKRVYIRSSDSGWKNNMGNVQFKSLETISEKHERWIDEVSELFGGLDMFALDVMKATNGKEHIIEVNDTAMGLMYEHEKEDVNHIVDLTIEKMNKVFVC